MLHAQRSSSESAFGRLPACLPDTPTSEMHQLSVSSSPASQSSSRPRAQCSRLRRAGSARGAGTLWGTSADSRVPRLLHKRGLYLNLTFFVSPLHMNIYREEGPASTPAAPFTESINNSFVRPDLGTED